MNLIDAQAREDRLSKARYPRDAEPSDGEGCLHVDRAMTLRTQQVHLSAMLTTAYGSCGVDVTPAEARAYAKRILKVAAEVEAEPWPKGCERCGYIGRGNHAYDCPKKRCKGEHTRNGRTHHMDGSLSCGCGVALSGSSRIAGRGNVEGRA